MFTHPVTVAILSTALATGLVCQDPVPGKGKAGGKVAQEASSKKDSTTLQTWDDKKAREVVSEFNKEYKANAPLKQKLAALEKLRPGKNPKLVKPLMKVVQTERKHTECRVVAAELLGNQPKNSVRKRLLYLIDDSKIKRRPKVLAALIKAHSKASYESRDWKDFEQLFYKDIADPRFPKVQKAIVQMAGDNKELQALNLLADSMEGPQPVWVDDPNNPPASYWEARWKNWEKWEQDAKDAMLKITGQRFATIKEAKTWVAKNRKKLEQEAKKTERAAKKRDRNR